MASLNKVFIIGNLVADPELRFTPNGAAVANFRVAVNRRYQNQNGERVEEASYFTVVAWSRQAEIINEHFRKGSPILVEGRLQSRSWETPEGQKRSTVEIVLEKFEFLGKAGGGARSDDTMAADADASLQAMDNANIDIDDVPF